MSFLELPFRDGFDTVSGRAVERGGKGWQTKESAMLSTCINTIVLGSERPALHAHPCQILLAQCSEIVDTANAMDGSVDARWLHDGCMSVSSGGTDFVAHPPPLMPILGLGRRNVLGCRGMKKLSRCCCCRRRTGFDSQANKR